MKIKNRTIIFIGIIIALTIIIINTVIVVAKRHDERLIVSMDENIKYYAKRCFLEEKCNENTTLQTLYDNNYISEQVNPVTKEVVDPNIKIEFINNEIIINYN